MQLRDESCLVFTATVFQILILVGTPDRMMQSARLSSLATVRTTIPDTARSIRMASGSTAKKLIQIDATIDTVCPWCLVGKRNLDKAIASSNGKYSFEIKYHPYLLDPSAPKEGIPKKDYYFNKFGPRAVQIEARMTEVLRGLGLEYDTSGLTGNTLDSHRLIYFAGKQGTEKQSKLVEELCVGYFAQGKFLGDRKFLVESAEKVGVEGAAEFLKDPNNGLNEVTEELKNSAGSFNGVPHYVINGKYELSGGQPPEAFLRAFQATAK